MEERDGIAYCFVAHRDGSDGGNHVVRIQEGLQGGDVVVHFRLPLLEGFEPALVVVHGVPQLGVVIVVARREGQGAQGYCDRCQHVGDAARHVSTKS